MPAFRIHSVKYNFFMNLLLTGSSVIFPLITFPLVSRALYADMYGLCNWSFSVASWFSLIAMLGVNRYGIREVAKNRDSPQKLVNISVEILLFTLLTTLVTYLCFIASIFVIPDFSSNRTLFLINGITILCNTLGVGWFFQGIEQYKFITIRGVSVKAICFIGVIALIHVPDDYLLYALLIVLSGALANLINFFYMLFILNNTSKTCIAHISEYKATPILACIKAENDFSLRRHIKPMLSFFVIAGAISVYTILDTVMLGFLSTNQQVGFYSASMSVKAALVGAVSALTGVLLPRASNLLSKGEIEKFRTSIKKCIIAVLLTSIPTSLLLSLLSTPLITLYAGADFAGAGSALSIVALAVIPNGLSIIFCDAVMIPNNLERYCVYIYISAAVIDFLGNLLLIPVFGAAGAAISTFIVEILVALIEFFIIRKIIWPSRKPN